MEESKRQDPWGKWVEMCVNVRVYIHAFIHHIEVYTNATQICGAHNNKHIYVYIAVAHTIYI